MSGHSKWSTIKRKKGKLDAKKGAMFTKYIKEITIAAKAGGGDPDMNPRLRKAVDTAKVGGMPKDNIERAIKRATGEIAGPSYESVTYEGYGPGGSAIFIEAFTGNKNRTASEIRHIFAKHNGNLGSNGCVAWMFVDKGVLYIDKTDATEEKLMEICLENGGEDVIDEEDVFKVVTPPDKFEAVKSALDSAKIKYKNAEFTKLPQSTVKVEGKDAEQTIKLMDTLEEQEDVQGVYANFDIPDEVLQAQS